MLDFIEAGFYKEVDQALLEVQHDLDTFCTVCRPAAALPQADNQPSAAAKLLSSVGDSRESSIVHTSSRVRPSLSRDVSNRSASSAKRLKADVASLLR
jgi:hypothetical protein